MWSRRHCYTDTAIQNWEVVKSIFFQCWVQAPFLPLHVLQPCLIEIPADAGWLSPTRQLTQLTRGSRPVPARSSWIKISECLHWSPFPTRGSSRSAGELLPLRAWPPMPTNDFPTLKERDAWAASFWFANLSGNLKPLIQWTSMYLIPSSSPERYFRRFPRLPV
jgi:hypothetical protein